MSQFYSIPEVAYRLLWRSEAKLRQMCKDGEIREAYQVGRMWLIPEAWMLNEELGEMAKIIELEKKLIEVAKQRTCINYEDAAPFLGLNMTLSNDRRLIGKVLDKISTTHFNAGKPILSAVVVHKHDGLPGKGFFKLARRLGIIEQDFDVRNEMAFYIGELERLYQYWA